MIKVSDTSKIAEEKVEERRKIWAPRTSLGKMVAEGRINSIGEVFEQGFKIKEPEIVDALLPDLKQEVLNVSLVQKQTDAGERARFKALVAVGNEDGYVGVGVGKDRQVRAAIEKATSTAKLNIVPVRRGCGSWECDCGQPHSLQFNVSGKCGSVRIELIPAPKGLGLIANESVKVMLRLAGVKDCWTKSRGSTKTPSSVIFATFDAIKNTYNVATPKDWAR